MLWVLTTAALLHLCLLAGLCRLWTRKASFPAPLPGAWPALSILIAARDEADNLAAHLPALLALDYPGEFEVLVALNHTTDGSKALLQRLAASHPQLRILDLPETPSGWSPKKYALSQAIAAARHDHFVLTDADCLPEPGWLSAHGRAFAGGAELVLGQSPYRRRPGLLNAVLRQETFQTALLYTGLARAGRPYMGVGRNIGYTRGFFEGAGGFGAHRGRLSGDDDLLVNAHGRGARTAVLVEEGSRTWSAAPGTWGGWLRQKIRHYSAGTAYGASSKLILGAYHGLQAIFYLSLIVVLCGAKGAMAGGFVFLLRSVLVAALLAAPARDWGKNAPVLLYPLLEPLLLLLQTVLAPASLVLKPKWKSN